LIRLLLFSRLSSVAKEAKFELNKEPIRLGTDWVGYK
jgi:hypothetical protein